MIPEYVKNIDQSPDDSHDCEMVLGSLDNLNTIAEIWKHHSSLFQMIELKALLDFTYSSDHTSEEAAAYKSGVESFGSFMSAALVEQGYRIKQAEELT